MLRALAPHQSGLGSTPTRCHKRVEFVVSSRLATRVFFFSFRFYGFPPSTKTNTLTSNSRNSKADVASSLNIVIDCFIYFIYKSGHGMAFTQTRKVITGLVIINVSCK